MKGLSIRVHCFFYSIEQRRVLRWSRVSLEEKDTNILGIFACGLRRAMGMLPRGSTESLLEFYPRLHPGGSAVTSSCHFRDMHRWMAGKC